MKLSILICTIYKRKRLFDLLMIELERQIVDAGYILYKDIEILNECDNGQMSIGTKRNLLMSRAKGGYICYFDDDDYPYPEYIQTIMTGLKSDPDCVMFKGLITFDGRGNKVFIHSLKYKSYFEENNIYYHPPNHLNAIRTSIAKQFKFPEIDFSEDTDWAMQICNSGILKTEAEIDNVIYHYRFLTRK